jgi:endonuclease YncB( thermonuclease family)
MPGVPSKNVNVKTYPALYRAVKACLLDGQQRIEEEKIRTYWETGRYIQLHVLQNGNRAEYGTRAIAKLAEDFDIAPSVLKQCRTFASRYSTPPIGHGRAQLKWAHFRKLMTILDEGERDRMEAAAQKNGWTSDELVLQIKAAAQRAPIGRPSAEDAEVVETSDVTSPSPSLVPLRGELYTYKIITPDNAERAKGYRVCVDLGFGEMRYEEPKLLAGFNAGDIVESVVKSAGAGYSYTTQSGRTMKDLYTYKAYLDRVIDGDTLKVEIDLGFVPHGRQEILRLRAIDCPELKTKAGDAAKAFVQSCLKGVPYIIICSSKTDNWERYLADIYIPKGGESDPETDIYLNQLLLDTGHAELWEP